MRESFYPITIFLRNVLIELIDYSYHEDIKCYTFQKSQRSKVFKKIKIQIIWKESIFDFDCDLTWRLIICYYRQIFTDHMYFCFCLLSTISYLQFICCMDLLLLSLLAFDYSNYYYYYDFCYYYHYHSDYHF